MALSLTDQGDLLTALHAISGAQPFAIFLDRFRRRVAARTAVIVDLRPREIWRVHHRTTPTDHLALDQAALAAMRRGRAIDLTGGARAIRSASDAGEQWLIAAGSRTGFDATDSALMTNLSPHVAIACENLARLETARTHLGGAEAALARAGVAWSLLDHAGQTVAGRAVTSQRSRVALIDKLEHGAPVAADDKAVALPLAGDEIAALALSRVATAAIDRATVFAAEHGCLRSEARLAVALAEGATIAEAAAALGITIETARHYSKRLYAITGAKGQGDLVRLVWTGLAGLG